MLVLLRMLTILEELKLKFAILFKPWIYRNLSEIKTGESDSIGESWELLMVLLHPSSQNSTIKYQQLCIEQETRDPDQNQNRFLEDSVRGTWWFSLSSFSLFCLQSSSISVSVASIRFNSGDAVGFTILLLFVLTAEIPPSRSLTPYVCIHSALGFFVFKLKLKLKCKCCYRSLRITLLLTLVWTVLRLTFLVLQTEFCSLSMIGNFLPNLILCIYVILLPFWNIIL